MPSKEEIRAVNRLLVKPMQDLQELDSQIFDLNNRLSEVESKRNETKNGILRLNSILSPIRGVPADVLGEIFYHCLPTHRNSIMKSNDCPLLLTHVCSQWRAVAMSSPRLWERLYITFTEDDTVPDIDTAAKMVRNGTFLFPNWHEALSNAEKEHMVKSLRRRYDAVKEWLSRSGSRPLSLSITFPTQHWYTVPYSQRPHSVTMELLSYLGSISPRIQDLELTGAPIQIYEALAKVIKVSEMTALTSLRIDLLRGFFERTTPCSAIFTFLQAPNLRKLSFIERRSDANDLEGLRDPSRRMQWSKLTSLTCIHALNIDETLAILENSPNLVHYKGAVSESGGDLQPFFYDGHISLPSLRTLSMSDSVKPQRLGNLYDCIDAPLLQAVSYYAADADSTNVPVPMPFLSLLRKSTHMQKLSIDTRTFCVCDLGPFLDAVPNITHLRIGPTNPLDFPDRPPQLDYNIMGVPRPQSLWSFRQLVVDQSNSTDAPFLPRLTSLTISSQTARIDADMIFDIVKSRMVPTMSTAALDHVQIRFFQKKTRDIAQELTRYAESLGVKIALDLEYLPPTSPERDPIHPEFGLIGGPAGGTWRYVDAGMDLEIP